MQRAIKHLCMCGYVCVFCTLKFSLALEGHTESACGSWFGQHCYTLSQISTGTGDQLAVHWATLSFVETKFSNFHLRPVSDLISMQNVLNHHLMANEEKKLQFSAFGPWQ